MRYLVKLYPKLEGFEDIEVGKFYIETDDINRFLSELKGFFVSFDGYSDVNEFDFEIIELDSD